MIVGYKKNNKKKSFFFPTYLHSVQNWRTKSKLSIFESRHYNNVGDLNSSLRYNTKPKPHYNNFLAVVVVVNCRAREMSHSFFMCALYMDFLCCIQI